MIAVAISGGKDSTATLLLAIEKFGKNNVIGIFTDTGFESSFTYKYLDYLQKLLNIKILKIKSKKWKNLPDLIKAKKRFPSIIHRFCTVHLKQIPMAEFLTNRKEIKELWLGIRTEESKNRKEKYQNFSSKDICYSDWLKISCRYVKKEIRKNLTHLYCKFPILNWTEKEVFSYLKKKKIEPNPLYQKGFKRVGCFPCILAKLREFELCWQDEEGRKNILLLAEIEKELNNKGYHTRLKINYTAKKLIEKLKLKEKQLNFFNL